MTYAKSAPYQYSIYPGRQNTLALYTKCERNVVGVVAIVQTEL